MAENNAPRGGNASFWVTYGLAFALWICVTLAVLLASNLTSRLSTWWRVFCQQHITRPPEDEDGFRAVEIILEASNFSDNGYRRFNARLDTGSDFNAIRGSLLKNDNGVDIVGPHQIKQIESEFRNIDGTQATVTQVLLCRWRGYDKICRNKMFFIDKSTKSGDEFYILPDNAPHDVIIGIYSIKKHGLCKENQVGGAGKRQLPKERAPGANKAHAESLQARGKQRKEKQNRNAENAQLAEAENAQLAEANTAEKQKDL